MGVPAFMALLELSADADERAVKRAYADRLKKIDQETDPEGFQRLRETYEAALNWVRKPRSAQAEADIDTNADAHADNNIDREGDKPKPQPTPHQRAPDASPNDHAAETPVPPVAQAPTATASSAAPENASPPPSALAQAVFAELLTALPSHVGNAEGMAAMLQSCIDDARLLNLDAKGMFEWLVGRHLLEGWRPGNDLLFDAAVACFQWHGERGRLDHLGSVGQVLDAAVQELALFKERSEVWQSIQWRLIERLRADALPSREYLINQMKQLDALVELVPNWLRIVIPAQSVRRWKQDVSSFFNLEVAPAPLEEPQRGTPPRAQAHHTQTADQKPSAQPKPKAPQTTKAKAAVHPPRALPRYRKPAAIVAKLLAVTLAALALWSMQRSDAPLASQEAAQPQATSPANQPQPIVSTLPSDNGDPSVLSFGGSVLSTHRRSTARTAH